MRMAPVLLCLLAGCALETTLATAAAEPKTAANRGPSAAAQVEALADELLAHLRVRVRP